MTAKSTVDPSYPIDFRWFSRNVLGGKFGILRADGQLLIDFGPRLGWHFYPISQAIFALGLLQLWREEKGQGYLKLAMKVCKVLLENSDDSEGNLGFPIGVTPLGYRLDPPWYSSLAQAFSSSALCRIGQILSEPSYVGAAMSSMDYVAESHVLCSRMSGDSLWFEEYPTKPPVHVLNGHIYCTIGFLELSVVTGVSRYSTHFKRGIESLALRLPLYDFGGIAYYDSVRRIPAKPYYQMLHTQQLEYLNSVFPSDRLAFFAARWKDGFKNRWGVSSWWAYVSRSLTNGLEVDGADFPLNALSYSLGDLGVSLRSRARNIGRGRFLERLTSA